MLPRLYSESTGYVVYALMSSQMKKNIVTLAGVATESAVDMSNTAESTKFSGAVMLDAMNYLSVSSGSAASNNVVGSVIAQAGFNFTIDDSAGT